MVSFVVAASVILGCIAWCTTSFPLVASTCSLTAGTNVSVGTQAGPRKFSVTAADCCSVCEATSLCIGAVFSNYYCSTYSSINAVEPAAQSTSLLRPATPSPPTTAAPTPAPPTPAPTPIAPPKGYALLTQCSVSTSCLRISDPTCTTQVVPVDSCVRVTDTESSSGDKQRYVSVASAANDGVQRHEYTVSDCSGQPKSSVTFPAQCTYEMNDYVSRMGVIVLSSAPTNQSLSYVVEGMDCSNADCTLPNGCTQAFSGSADECLTSLPPGSGSSSSSSDAAVPAVSYHCFSAQQMVAVLPFESINDCLIGKRVMGNALPTQQCYYDDAERHYYNLCNPK